MWFAFCNAFSIHMINVIFICRGLRLWARLQLKLRPRLHDPQRTVCIYRLCRPPGEWQKIKLSMKQPITVWRCHIIDDTLLLTLFVENLKDSQVCTPFLHKFKQSFCETLTLKIFLIQRIFSKTKQNSKNKTILRIRVSWIPGQIYWFILLHKHFLPNRHI